VLSYLLDELPQRLGHPVALDLISGTSVGAIHACYLAATAHEAVGRGRKLARLWEHMGLSEVFGASALGLLQMPVRMLGLLRRSGLARGEHLPDRLRGLLDTSALEDLVRNAIPWRSLRENVAAGRLDAICVAATEVSTGRVVVFVESRHPKQLRWTRDPSIVAQSVRLSAEHALASAAIPGLFPAVRLGEAYYSDGGLRLNTPLSPALRLGTDRVLVIALGHGVTADDQHPLRAGRLAYSASPIFLLGKVLNALLLDHIDRDLRQMRLLNDILRRAQEVGGLDLLDRINETVERDRGQPFKIVEDLVIRPSADLGIMATEAARDLHGHSATSRGIRLVLRTLGFVGNPFEADLLSYLFFDRQYTAPLLKLGLEDARGQEEALMGFFSE
jgi:NTE family protein